MTIDYSSLPNPFDFANPINDPKIFAGRQKILDDIEYYLDHAKKAQRPINLAIIGERASGKTSLLNMIHLGLEKRDICSVRVDLDESDAEFQLMFFYKLFDSILTTICNLNFFGGIHSKTYDTYRNMIDTLDIPDDKSFCLFQFPLQYVRALRNNNLSAPLSDTNFKNDLILLQNSINKPIAILIDECDILSKSRVHLEKIRNLFMNISGYMLVFTGSQALFPLMNDIFSPIIRQFKKINVVPFIDEKETKDCIFLPLKKIGIESPNDEINFETLRDISEIHDLSGGRPYEIQLICHFLFKRLQLGQNSKMELSVEVLDDVLNELQSTQDVYSRPIPSKIRSFEKEDLSLLSRLCTNIGHVSVDQIWFDQYLFSGDKRWEKHNLETALSNFIEMGLLSVDQNKKIKFLGDDFDKIYCKYYSRKQRVQFNISEIPFDIRLRLRIDSLIRNNIKGFKNVGIFQNDESMDSDIDNCIQLITSGHYEENLRKLPFYLIEAIYEMNCNYNDDSQFPLINLLLDTPWEKGISIWYKKDDINCSTDNCSEQFEESFLLYKERTRELGGKLDIIVYKIPTISKNDLANQVALAINKIEKSKFVNFHMEKVINFYTELHDIDLAVENAGLAIFFADEITIDLANNLGYLFMSISNFEKAEELFLIGINERIVPKDMMQLDEIDRNTFINNLIPLIYYNLGILYLMKEDPTNSLKYINNCLQTLNNLDQNEHGCFCLFIPKLDGNTFQFEEHFNVDLLDFSKSTKVILDTYFSNNI